jgi:hypothetical protein
MSRGRKVIIVHDEQETFTRSNCDCNFCASMHNSIQEWDTFVPETNLQRRMKETVARIENRISDKPRRITPKIV